MTSLWLIWNWVPHALCVLLTVKKPLFLLLNIPCIFTLYRVSSGQSSWLQILRPGFDSRHYQKKKVVGLEWGPLSLASTTEELLDRKVAAPVWKTENTAGRIRHADPVAHSIRKSWQSLRRQAAVTCGLRPWSFFTVLWATVDLEICQSTVKLQHMM
jgi:hypothetical protein